MNLYDERARKFKEKKEKKLKTKILISIIILIILIICTISAILFLMYDPNKIILKLNGVENEKILSILDIEEDENGNKVIYVPIKKIAPYLGYKAYNGEYQMASEENSKCYIISDYEVVEFTQDSKVIYKLNLEEKATDYEECQIKTKVFANKNDGELYIDSEGIEEAFNISLKYNDETKTINIITLDKIVEAYSKYIDTSVYEKIDESFNNKKAVLNDFIIVDSLNKQKGVLQIKNGKVKNLLEPKYDEIKYIQYDSSFLITTNKKVGIISSNGETKVIPAYDTLTLINKDNNLYLASKDNLYGVIDGEGNVIIHLEYNKIGVDTKSFADTGVKNGYILADNLIPVMLEQKWGFFNIKGQKITELAYSQIGCTGNSSSNIYNLLEVPNYNVIVVGKDKKYTLIDINGKELFNCVIDKMYKKVANGNTNYYMEINTEARDIVEYLKEMGINSIEEKNNSNKKETGNVISANNTINTTNVNNNSSSNDNIVE